jgi:hypothetical protein
VTTKPELLAHHFREAGLPAKAFDYAMRAGDAAVARYATAEARGRFGEARSTLRIHCRPRRTRRARRSTRP